MPQLTINRMIEEDLGYCCEFLFFRLYKKTAVVASRLGVTTRAVRYHKEAAKACEGCPGKANCMKKALEVKR